MRGGRYRVVGSVVLLWALVGCSTIPQSSGIQPDASAIQWWNSFGIRPYEPVFTGDRVIACIEFREFVKYIQRLQEAYLSRATQNRFWIYVSGTTGLGTIAVSAGLAAAATPSFGTLALIPIAGGFASSVFAILDNSTLADIYTIAANDLGRALQKAGAMLQQDAQGKALELPSSPTEAQRQAADEARRLATCAAAHADLWEKVTGVRNDLERARTNSAVAALQRAAAQTEQYTQLAAQIRAQVVTQAVGKGEITAIHPSEAVVGQEPVITLTVSNVNLASIGFNEVKVGIGTETRSVHWTLPDPKTGDYAVKFSAPAKPPITNKLTYPPVLLVGSAQTRVESRPDVILTYKP